MRAIGSYGHVVATCCLIAMGCGSGASNDREQTTGPEQTTEPIIDRAAGRYQSQPTFPEIPVDIVSGEPLEMAFTRARQAYHRENIETFDSRIAYATSAAAGFAQYFTINDASDPQGRTQHVFFVMTEPWDIDTTRAFLLSYIVMPGAPDSEAGRLWFHFYGADTPPFAVRFLFSNTAAGALEAGILAELGASAWDLDRLPTLVERVEDLLIRIESLDPEVLTNQVCPNIFDELYTRLPLPSTEDPVGIFDRQYLPEGTLAAIGLLVGESIRRNVDVVVEWETDDASDIYPRLRVSGETEGIMRPISMLIELFLSNVDVGPTEYCNRMVERLSGPSPAVLDGNSE